MSKILIFGATSFIGINLVKKLYINNQIIAVLRKNSENDNKLDSFKNIQKIYCDMDEYYRFDSFYKDKADIAYLLSWRGVHGSLCNDENVQRENFENNLALFKILCKMNIKTIMTIGSQAEFGDFNEPANYLLKPKPTNAYGIYKLKLFEQLCEESKKYKVNYKHGRIFSCYGIGDNPNTLIMTIINSFKKNEKVNLTKCEQVWDYIYIDDCIDAIVDICDKGKCCHPYSIGSGEAHKLEYYVEIIRSSFKEANVEYGYYQYNKGQPMFVVANIQDLIKDTGFKKKTCFLDGIKRIIKGN
ncbi:MAG: NAD(P)-dependent oxidoreductase [Bacilli bacterium]